MLLNFTVFTQRAKFHAELHKTEEQACSPSSGGKKKPQRFILKYKTAFKLQAERRVHSRTVGVIITEVGEKNYPQTHSG